MTCDCRLCQDDRECSADRLARAARLRAEGRDIEEAEWLEEAAARTLERINSYPPQGAHLTPAKPTTSIGRKAVAAWVLSPCKCDWTHSQSCRLCAEHYKGWRQVRGREPPRPAPRGVWSGG